VSGLGPVAEERQGRRTTDPVVEDQAKKEFDTQDRALKAARELKGRFPNLQVKVFDAENKQSETIELAAA
jgi:hypothetical protein